MKKILSSIFLSILAALALPINAGAQKANIEDRLDDSGQFAPLFPFQPTHNTPDNITNVRTWDNVSGAPAGSTGFIRSEGDHFVDGNGTPMRFIGTNIGMTGCFPSHEDADKVAAELTRYGINIVRMHYVSHRTPKDGYPVKDSFIEPVQLERFDYLFAKLKENGIYIYFQLNIARKATKANGLENVGPLPYYKNGLDNFEYVLVNLQKRFHKEILEHVNPYTGIAYKDDPAIGMFELANENSIVYSWYSPKHKFTALSEPYKTRMVAIWNKWLKDKYGTTANLKKAWEERDGDSGKMIVNTIADGCGGWAVQPARKGKATCDEVKASKKDKLEGKSYVHVEVQEADKKTFSPKIMWSDFQLGKMKSYCVRLKVRAAEPVKLTIRAGQRTAPYKAAGLSATINATKRWEEYKFNFISTIDDSDLKVFLSGFSEGDAVDIADLCISEGMDYELPGEQSLEEGTVEWPYIYNKHVPWQRAKDWAEFIGTLERNYFGDLYNNVKNNLGVRQCVTGTQLAYGFNVPQAATDYCDIHDYWCHPFFPGGKWSWTHWQLRNDAIVNGAGTYGDQGCPGSTYVQMARARILGKPFTVSEYDHPNLNYYSAEGNLMLSAMGAFQNWSALMQFAWILDTNFDRDNVNGMFDMCSAPQKLVHFPACWSMFVRGDVRKGSDKLAFAYPSSYERDIEKVAFAQAGNAHRNVDSDLLKSLPLAVVSGRELKERPDLFNPEGKVVIHDEADVPQALQDAFSRKVMKSTTGELTWDWSNPEAGVFMVDSRRTKAFSGFVRGRSFTFSGMRLTPGRTRLDWLTLTLTQAHADGESRNRSMLAPGTYLLAATGVVRNTGQKTMKINNKHGRVSYSEEDGGNPGTGPVLCEGIEAELAFAGLQGRVECYALDPDGNRTAAVDVAASPAGEAVVNIGPQYRTVWYELIVKPKDN